MKLPQIVSSPMNVEELLFGESHDVLPSASIIRINRFGRRKYVVREAV